MNLRNSFLALIALALFFSCKDKPTSVTQETVVYGKHLIPYNSPLLNTDDPGIAIIDFRKPEAYQQGHIPGAIQFYRDDFQDTTRPYSGIRIDKKMTADRLGKAGITDRHTIVVYDDKGESC